MCILGIFCYWNEQYTFFLENTEYPVCLGKLSAGKIKLVTWHWKSGSAAGWQFSVHFRFQNLRFSIYSLIPKPVSRIVPENAPSV